MGTLSLISHVKVHIKTWSRRYTYRSPPSHCRCDIISSYRINMKLSIFALAALAPLALAKDFTLYFSTHNKDYTLNTSGGNSVEGVKLSDDKGALKVLGSYTFTAPGTTMIALSISQSSVCWVSPILRHHFQFRVVVLMRSAMSHSTKHPRSILRIWSWRTDHRCQRSSAPFDQSSRTPKSMLDSSPSTVDATRLWPRSSLLEICCRMQACFPFTSTCKGPAFRSAGVIAHRPVRRSLHFQAPRFG
jgi:hypothetical protein